MLRQFFLCSFDVMSVLSVLRYAFLRKIAYANFFTKVAF